MILLDHGLSVNNFDVVLAISLNTVTALYSNGKSPILYNTLSFIFLNMLDRQHTIENLRISETLASLRTSFYDVMQKGFLHEPMQCFRNSGFVRNIVKYQLSQELLKGEMDLRMAVVSNGPFRDRPWPFVLSPNHSMLREYEAFPHRQTTWDFHWFCYLRVHGDSPYNVILDTSIIEERFGYTAPQGHLDHISDLFYKGPLFGGLGNLYLVDMRGEVLTWLNPSVDIRNERNVNIIKEFVADTDGYWGRFKDYNPYKH